MSMTGPYVIRWASATRSLRMIDVYLDPVSVESKTVVRNRRGYTFAAVQQFHVDHVLAAVVFGVFGLVTRDLFVSYLDAGLPEIVRTILFVNCAWLPESYVASIVSR